MCMEAFDEQTLFERKDFPIRQKAYCSYGREPSQAKNEEVLEVDDGVLSDSSV